MSGPRYSSAVLTAAALLAATLLWGAPGGPRRPAHHQAPAKPHTPAAPSTPAALQRQLVSALSSGRYAHDAIQVQVGAGDVTLTGVVHNAESKGLATRQARTIAARAGWKTAHVYNRITIALPPA